MFTTFVLVVFSEFISEGIGGSRETAAYCFFIINSEKLLTVLNVATMLLLADVIHLDKNIAHSLANKFAMVRHISVVTA